MSDPTWPQVVGYRHEILHTAVLRHLLCDVTRSAAVAGALIGVNVVRVLRSQGESKIPNVSGRADLIADVELVQGQTVSLAVETKVDSNATREQLTATSGPPHHGVLLALGITAMNLTERGLGFDPNTWTVVTPATWGEVLKGSGAAEDALLAPYLVEVEREADEHARAREFARESVGPSWHLESSRRRDGLLEHYAWLAEIRDRLADPEDWWTYTNRSGPLMGYWSDDFQRPGRDTFLEFMCSDRERILCLKVGGGEADLRSTAADALARVQGLGWQAPRRRPSSSAGTCTAAWLDFSGLEPVAAAARTRQAIAEVRRSRSLGDDVEDQGAERG